MTNNDDIVPPQMLTMCFQYSYMLYPDIKYTPPSLGDALICDRCFAASKLLIKGGTLLEKTNRFSNRDPGIVIHLENM